MWILHVLFERSPYIDIWAWKQHKNNFQKFGQGQPMVTIYIDIVDIEFHSNFKDEKASGSEEQDLL